MRTSESKGQVDAPINLPLLSPINESEAGSIELEVSDLLARGFRTFKVKVGKSVADDLARVRVIQDVLGGRATLRLDANRGFDREQRIAFAKGLPRTASNCSSSLARPMRGMTMRRSLRPAPPL